MKKARKQFWYLISVVSPEEPVWFLWNLLMTFGQEFNATEEENLTPDIGFRLGAWRLWTHCCLLIEIISHSLSKYQTPYNQTQISWNDKNNFENYQK